MEPDTVDGNHELTTAGSLLLIVTKAAEDFSEEGWAGEFGVFFKGDASPADEFVRLAI